MNKGGREQTGWKGNRQDGVRKLEVGDRPGLDAGLGSGGKSGGILWSRPSQGGRRQPSITWQPANLSWIQNEGSE